MKEKFDSTVYYGTSSQIVFARFLGELKTPKRHFKLTDLQIQIPYISSNFSLNIVIPEQYHITKKPIQYETSDNFSLLSNTLFRVSNNQLLASEKRRNERFPREITETTQEKCSIQSSILYSRVISLEQLNVAEYSGE